MKRTILIWLLTVNCVLAKAQFTVIPTNTNEILRNIVKLDSIYFVQNYGSLFLYSSDTFNSVQTFSIPANPNYTNKLKSKQGNLFLISSDFNTDHMQFWVSTNKGLSWELRFDSIGFFTDDFVMFDSSEGYVLPYFNNAYSIKNGGKSWQHNFLNTSVGFFIEEYGDSVSVRAGIERLYTTKNRYITTNQSYCSFLLNPMRCFIMHQDTVLVTSTNPGNYFVYTTNFGSSWHSIETTPFSGRGMYFFNRHEGYVVGRDYQVGQGAVFKTTDMGQTWAKYYTGIDCILQDIEFMNDSIAIITGTNGVLLRWNKHGAPTEVETFNSRLDVSITPNPSNNEHMLKLSIQQLKSIPCCTLLDVSGRELAVYTMESKGQGEYALKNNTASLPNGLYFYKVEVDGITYTVKFIVTH